MTRDILQWFESYLDRVQLWTMPGCCHGRWGPSWRWRKVRCPLTCRRRQWPTPRRPSWAGCAPATLGCSSSGTSERCRWCPVQIITLRWNNQTNWLLNFSYNNLGIIQMTFNFIDRTMMAVFCHWKRVLNLIKYVSSIFSLSLLVIS